MSDRMALLESLSRNKPATHSCPTCTSPVACNIAQGKTTCWCFNVQAGESLFGDVCLCKQCLVKTNDPKYKTT